MAHGCAVRAGASKSYLLFGSENASVGLSFTYFPFGHSKESKVAERAKHQVNNDQIAPTSADELNQKTTSKNSLKTSSSHVDNKTNKIKRTKH